MDYSKMSETEFISALQTLNGRIVLMELNMLECPLFKSVAIENGKETGSIGANDTVLTLSTKFLSAAYTTAYNQLREARMFLGEVLLEIGGFKPYDYFNKTGTDNLQKTPAHLVLVEANRFNWFNVVFEAEKARLAKAGKAIPEGFAVGSVAAFVPTKQIELDAILYYKKLIGSNFDDNGLYREINTIMELSAEPTNILGKCFDTKIDYVGKITEANHAMYDRKYSGILHSLSNVLTCLSKANKYFGLRMGELA
jgi:hypothetical protein